MGQLSENDFLGLTLFDAFDREHAAMIRAGLSTRWPEEVAEEREWIADTMREIMGGRVTDRAKE